VVKMIPNNPNDPTRGKDNFVGTESLVLMDLAGKVVSTTAEGKGIESVGWSPDSSKLAYVITKSEQPPELYVTEAKNSHPTLMAVNLLGNPVEWSPSGNMLFTNGYADIQQPDQGTALYVITLKR
jgi:Tol biopolymer transport system component